MSQYTERHLYTLFMVQAAASYSSCRQTVTMTATCYTLRLTMIGYTLHTRSKQAQKYEDLIKHANREQRKGEVCFPFHSLF